MKLWKKQYFELRVLFQLLARQLVYQVILQTRNRCFLSGLEILPWGDEAREETLGRVLS